ncbi:hypothetical protein [Methylobacter sp. S3L5C]|uniref:hypothetical protein n=1 Tax=Methylobacter sp. S3L5C TaxID=2839024 RepID=UPI001FAC6220|nr:hypothetical protein [Methylobacter sp. S3L5C]UOA07974.1 hypothetical protein KKZ03_17265 [Methylobacter sp. S3L5C]
MKKLPALLLILSCATLVACGRGQEINGHNTATAYRSVKSIKNRFAPDKRIEFEVSFWTIRDAKKDDKEFLDAVDGKNPDEIIAMGREIYQERKAAGFKAYESYSSWDEMIAKFGKERIDQDNRKKGSKDDPDKNKPNDSILYKL